MNRALLSLAIATSLTVLGYVATAQESHDHSMANDACAKACNDCQRACDTCGSHCGQLVAEGKKEHLVTLRTCQDCATICSAASSIVSRSGPFSSVICDSCAYACKQCAAACEKHKEDAMMNKCAEECKKCEKACREMTSTSHPTK